MQSLQVVAVASRPTLSNTGGEAGKKTAGEDMDDRDSGGGVSTLSTIPAATLTGQPPPPRKQQQQQHTPPVDSATTGDGWLLGIAVSCDTRTCRLATLLTFLRERRTDGL
jgi:hypothetical protein